MPHTCSAERRTRAVGATGGSKDSWTALWSSRLCFRQPAGDAEHELAARRHIEVTHKVYFTSDPEVDERDQLVFSDGNYLVRSRPIPDASLGFGIVWRVMVDSRK